MVIIGCSSDDNGIRAYGTDQASFFNIPKQDCPTPVEVTTAGEIVALVEATGYGLDSQVPYYGRIPITTDIKVTGTIEFSVDDFTPKQENLVFSIKGDVPGLTPQDFVETSHGAYQGEAGYHKLVLSDTVFRIRPIAFDLHPAGGSLIILEIRGACPEQCGDDWELCPGDHLCYPPGKMFCVYCANRKSAECSCYQAEKILEDGSQCHYDQSVDVAVEGVCQDEICVGASY